MPIAGRSGRLRSGLVLLALATGSAACGATGSSPLASPTDSAPASAGAEPTASSAPAATPSVARVESPCDVGEPENLGPDVNGVGFDGGPAIGADGLELWFVSDRPGGHGGGDIWVTRRSSTDARFGRPENAGEGVNDTANEGAPTL